MCIDASGTRLHLRRAQCPVGRAFNSIIFLGIGGFGAYGPRRKEPCLPVFANIKGADQPAHPRSLISAFVIRLLESIISKLATGEIKFSS